MKSNGFTLLELMITCSILAILVLFGIPSLSNQIQNVKLRTTTGAMLDAIGLTRCSAISKNRRVTMVSKDDWTKGWDIFIDNNNNGKLDEGEIILQSHDELSGIKISANTPVKNYISYTGSGESRNANGNINGGFQAGTIKICSTNNHGVKIVIARGGRARVEDLLQKDCEF